MSTSSTNHWQDRPVAAGGGISLRATLVIDAVSSGVLGVVALLSRPRLTGWLGLSDRVLLIAGVILVLAAVLVLITAAVAARPGPLLRLVAIGNAGWVVLSVGWLMTQFNELTTFGVILIAGQALVVTLYVLRYARALR